MSNGSTGETPLSWPKMAVVQRLCLLHPRAPLAYRWATGRRLFHYTATRMDTYSVKDEKEFATKVLGSEKPVVVDFFATYVRA